jgi:chromate transporter
METAAPSCWALFATFLEIGARSFGGAAAWAREVLVERRGWLGDAEFTEALGLGQVVPGPNVVNLAVHLGDRFRGWRGAASASAGLVGVPTAGAILLDVALMRWLHIPAVATALGGLAAGAAGLVLALGVTLGQRLRGQPIPLALAGLTFLLAGPLRVPLPVVLLALAPVSLGWAWRRAR